MRTKKGPNLRLSERDIERAIDEYQDGENNSCFAKIETELKMYGKRYDADIRFSTDRTAFFEIFEGDELLLRSRTRITRNTKRGFESYLDTIEDEILEADGEFTLIEDEEISYRGPAIPET